jgi:hypothetical protein
LSAVGGVTVYVKSFDVDDPSTDAGPVDPNGSGGDDNKGMPIAGTLTASALTTDSSGVATGEFTTTMQPGDNFVVAASTKLDYLNGISVNATGLNDSTNNLLPTANAQRTAMLTIWRRLHVETDSMGQVNGNTVAGLATRFAGSSRPQSTIQVNQALEVDRFSAGRIDISGTGAFTVESNTVTTVTLANATVLLPPFGTNFTLVDDDNFDLGPGPYNGDDGEDIPQPNTTRIQDSDNPNDNLFAPAYVRPIYDIPDNNGSVPFVLNTQSESGQGIRATFDFDNVASEDDDDFWTAYVLNSYQCDPRGDTDPLAEQNTNFVALAVTDALNGQGSALFLEMFAEYDGVLTPIDRPPYTVGHEFGHLFGSDHPDGGLMAETGTPQRTGSFSAITINRIRSINHP